LELGEQAKKDATDVFCWPEVCRMKGAEKATSSDDSAADLRDERRTG